MTLHNWSDCCREFVDQKKSHSANLTDADIDKLINRHFPDWLEQKVQLTMYLYYEFT